MFLVLVELLPLIKAGLEFVRWINEEVSFLDRLDFDLLLLGVGVVGIIGRLETTIGIDEFWEFNPWGEVPSERNDPGSILKDGDKREGEEIVSIDEIELEIVVGLGFVPSDLESFSFLFLEDFSDLDFFSFLSNSFLFFNVSLASGGRCFKHCSFKEGTLSTLFSLDLDNFSLSFSFSLSFPFSLSLSFFFQDFK